MTYEEIKVLVQSQYIHCKLFLRSKIKRNVSVVIVHGWTSSDKKYLPLGELLSKNGFNVLVINLRGHGDSKYSLGNFSRKDHELDIVSAISYMKHNFKGSKLCLLGKSYGGYLSAIVAKREKVDYLIVSQPALYSDADYNVSTEKLIAKDPDIFKQTKGNPQSNKALRGIVNFKKDFLLIESEKDEEVPKETTNLYFRYGNKDNLTNIALVGADHTLTKEDWKEDFYSKVNDWLMKETSE